MWPPPSSSGAGSASGRSLRCDLPHRGLLGVPSKIPLLSLQERSTDDLRADRTVLTGRSSLPPPSNPGTGDAGASRFTEIHSVRASHQHRALFGRSRPDPGHRSFDSRVPKSSTPDLCGQRWTARIRRGNKTPTSPRERVLQNRIQPGRCVDKWIGRVCDGRCIGVLADSSDRAHAIEFLTAVGVDRADDPSDRARRDLGCSAGPGPRTASSERARLAF
jgi:hypothetical protein